MSITRGALCRLAAMTLIIVVALGVTRGLAAQPQTAPANRPVVNAPAFIAGPGGGSMAVFAGPKVPPGEGRLPLVKTGLAGLPALPKEMDLLSDIAVRLLSGNVAKLLADVCAELFSGNSAELFSGNEPSLLSDNTTELLSRNEPELLSDNATELLSRNEPELLSGNDTRLFSGNKVQLFSNIKVEINVADSGNNNGNNAPPPPRVAPPVKPKKPAKPAALGREQSGTVSVGEPWVSKGAMKLRQAKSRFSALDTNGDGVLSFEEFAAQDNGGASVAQR